MVGSVEQSVWPFFVIGAQRAGTTLLTRILSAHDDVFVQNEGDVHTLFAGSGDPQSIVDKAKSLISGAKTGTFEQWMSSEGKKLWGFKDPELTQYLEVLERFVGRSKFILIVRDARGVVNSYKHNKWGLGTNAYTGAKRWVREVSAQLAFLEKYPNDVILVRYEDLVSNPRDTILAACNHLSIAFDESMLEYFKKKSYISARRESQHVDKPLSTSLSEKWKKELSQREIQIVNWVAEDLLERMNYSVGEGALVLSKLEKFFYNMHQAIIGEMQLQYRWRLSLIKRRWNR